MITIRSDIKAKHKVKFCNADAQAVGLWHTDSDEIFDVRSGLKLDNGSFYPRFPSVKRKMQRHLAGGQRLSFILLWKYLLFGRIRQHSHFPTCCSLAADFTSDCSGASDPQKNICPSRNANLISVCPPAGFRIPSTEYAD